MDNWEPFYRKPKTENRKRYYYLLQVQAAPAPEQMQTHQQPHPGGRGYGRELLKELRLKAPKNQRVFRQGNLDPAPADILITKFNCH